jgi:hypothetical protein
MISALEESGNRRRSSDEWLPSARMRILIAPMPVHLLFAHHMDSVRDLLEAHDVASYPLAGGDEADGVALVLLDADIAGLATTYLASGGALPAEQWRALRECAAVARVVVPSLSGDAWVYFARLYALTQAMLRSAPDIPGE